MTTFISVMVAIFTLAQAVSAGVAIYDSRRNRRIDEDRAKLEKDAAEQRRRRQESEDKQRRLSDGLIQALDVYTEANGLDVVRERHAKKPLDEVSTDHLKAMQNRLMLMGLVLAKEGILPPEDDLSSGEGQSDDDPAQQIARLIQSSLADIEVSVPAEDSQKLADEMYTDNAVKPTETVEKAKAAGLLEVGPDSPVFRTHAEVAYLFGKRYKQYMRAVIALPNDFSVWFPGFNPDDPKFDNRLSADGKTITDRAEPDAPPLTPDEKARKVIVFGKDKGMDGYQFKGVFVSESRSDEKTVRKQVSDVVYFDTNGKYDIKPLS